MLCDFHENCGFVNVLICIFVFRQTSVNLKHVVFSYKLIHLLYTASGKLQERSSPRKILH